jgi:hypothetical protein
MVALGGHPMDLAPGGEGPLLPEFIHEQVEHTIAQWDAAGGRCEKTTRATAVDIAGARRQHHERLVATYGVAVTQWMPDTM